MTVFAAMLGSGLAGERFVALCDRAAADAFAPRVWVPGVSSGSSVERATPGWAVVESFPASPTGWPAAKVWASDGATGPWGGNASEVSGSAGELKGNAGELKGLSDELSDELSNALSDGFCGAITTCCGSTGSGEGIGNGAAETRVGLSASSKADFWWCSALPLPSVVELGPEDAFEATSSDSLNAGIAWSEVCSAAVGRAPPGNAAAFSLMDATITPVREHLMGQTKLGSVNAVFLMRINALDFTQCPFPQT